MYKQTNKQNFFEAGNLDSSRDLLIGNLLTHEKKYVLLRAKSQLVVNDDRQLYVVFTGERDLTDV